MKKNVFKTAKILESTHRKIIRHLRTKKETIYEFIDAAISEKIHNNKLD